MNQNLYGADVFQYLPSQSVPCIDNRYYFLRIAAPFCLNCLVYIPLIALLIEFEVRILSYEPIFP